jgi:hypothetical protein
MDDLPELLVTESGLTLGSDTIAFDEVDTVGYLRKPVNGSGALLDIVRRFELIGGGRTVSAKLDGAKVLVEQKEMLWRQLVAVSQEWVEPRLRDQALERLLRGGAAPLRFGRLELSRDGFAWYGTLKKVKRYPWSEFGEAYYGSSRIRILATPKGNKLRKLGDLHTDVPNSVLLPRLMTDAAAALASPI